MLSESVQRSDADVVERCRKLLAHAWMVRTFIKHGEEVEEFPELMGIVRGVFDLTRAVETRADDPQAYLKMLRKKLPRFRKAVEQFAHDAPLASTHINFEQAVISVRAVAEELEKLLPPVSAPPVVQRPGQVTAREESAPDQSRPGSGESEP